MRGRYRAFLVPIAVLFVLGCASQPDEAPVGAPETQGEGPARLAALVGFVDGTGRAFESGATVTLPTGGPPEGRLIPNTDEDLTMYVTRDGSEPGPQNNWGGPIQPGEVVPISRALEGAATYAVIGEIDGELTEPVVVNVIWQHEENPDLDRPEFTVDGSTVGRNIELITSDGTDPEGQLMINCNYLSSILYVTRDGSEPSADNYWQTQSCLGTFIWAPEPTAAEYRVVAVWQGVSSPVASITVEWVEPE
ncbi:MAG: hypothetical protein ACLFP4_09285 [Spirochaetales bacterium]